MMRAISEILAAFEALPVTDIGALLRGRRPLILAPHPDDESLGCGGLIAAACAAGIAPIVVILTNGAASHPGSKTWPPGKLAALRELEASQAVQYLGLPDQNLFFFRQPDAALAAEGDLFDMLVARAGMLGEQNGCSLVIGPWAGDSHCDHEAAARIAAAVAERNGWTLLSYPVWGWLRDQNSVVDEDRQHGWRLNIAAHLHHKNQAIAAHVSQYGELITDSPDAFRLPETLLEIFSRPFEVFLA
jgi:LmbE family N-acetylglucosaminyl deacetylase